MGVDGLGPASQGNFLTGIELDAFVALDVQVAEERAVPAGEWEPGHRRGDADIDPDHPGVEVLLELPRRPAAAGEDGGAIAVGAVAADGQRLVEVGGADDREDRPE